MRYATLFWLVGLLVCPLASSAALAHSPYGRALKERHELRSVSCYACHVKGKNEDTGKPLGKEHLNEFGEVLRVVLEDKNFTQRLEAAKELSREERDKVNQEAAVEFLKALEQIENKAATGGKTWTRLIKSGDLEGIRIAE